MAVRVSGGNLAGAVAKAGGIGVISSWGLGLNSPYFQDNRQRGQFFAANRLALIDELQTARSISPQGIIAVNVLVATRDYAEMVQTAAANGANIIITGAGVPLNLPEYTAKYPDVALVPIVCGLEAVQQICQTWLQCYHRLPDAFIVENAQSVGGHIGTTCGDYHQPENTIDYLLAQLQDYLLEHWGVEIPLIATGGIWDREDIDRMLAMGASGVQMGTRFITTDECDAHPRYKEFHLQAHRETVTIVPSPVGKPARALHNNFADRALVDDADLDRMCVGNCLKSCLCRDRKTTYCILQALSTAAQGNIEEGLVFAGSGIKPVERIMPVAELMLDLTRVVTNK
jgi:nitronate monooxygenase